jgi:hypothetical protein
MTIRRQFNLPAWRGWQTFASLASEMIDGNRKNMGQGLLRTFSAAGPLPLITVYWSLITDYR